MTALVVSHILLSNGPFWSKVGAPTLEQDIFQGRFVPLPRDGLSASALQIFLEVRVAYFPLTCLITYHLLGHLPLNSNLSIPNPYDGVIGNPATRDPSDDLLTPAVAESVLLILFLCQIAKCHSLRPYSPRKKSNVSLQIADIQEIWNVRPRRSDDVFGMSCRVSRSSEITLLASALLQNHTKIFNWLLHHKDEIGIIDIRSSDAVPEQILPHWTALFVALVYRRQKAAMKLLDHGAPPTAVKSGITALHLAAAGGLLEMLKRLVQHYGFDINQPDDRGDTPLIYALSSPRVGKKLLGSLIRLGADVNKPTICQAQYLSPLSIAIMVHRWDLVMELLNSGADAGGKMEVMLDQQGRQPTKPLSCACFTPQDYPQGTNGQRKAVIARLLEEGGDPNMLITYNNESQPLLIRLIRMKREWEAAHLMASPLLNVNERDRQGMSALDWALCTKHGRPTLAELLLQHHAEPPLSTIRGIASLMTRVWVAAPCQIYDLLRRNPKFFPSYQVLYKHLSNIAPVDKGRYVKEFLRGCPAPVARRIEQAGQVQLNNNVLLECMKQSFNVCSAWSRRAARQGTAHTHTQR
ncbi:hypothetical protein JX265_013961 [Neoarthrinium moseri]|uniref:Uncharacterized protein n=1 Tax=Neoarthrinium moseri TaxID=1658444 RepID=A0A9P9W7Q2_9PEZI|nr:hypothetical protein JX265_013961 [Neoarthrinium moseri]